MQTISYALITVFSVSISMLIGGAFTTSVKLAGEEGQALSQLFKALGGM